MNAKDESSAENASLDEFDAEQQNLNAKGYFIVANTQVAAAYREYAINFLKSLGKSFLGGQIMHRAIPAAPGVFCGESQLETVASHFAWRGRCEANAVSQLVGLALSVMYNSVQAQLKPFNPIIGETLFMRGDGVRVTAEYIANHPPTCLTRIKGQNYEIDAIVALEASLRLNGVSVRRSGVALLTIDNKTHGFVIPRFQVHGLLSGNRWGRFVGEIQFWLDCGREIPMESLIKQKMSKNPDFQIKVGDNDRFDALHGEYCDKPIHGTWTETAYYGETVIFNAAEPSNVKLEAKGELPSDQSFREDIYAFRGADYDTANRIKNEYESLQRSDRKARVI